MTTLWQLESVALGRRLADVSMRIEPGITAILGPSGAGKTSLVDVLVGFERPTAGRVERAGAATTPAWVPSDDGLWPQLTARAHLECVARDRAIVAPLLDAFELAARATARPAELSRGERARLAVARALATGAGVVVMDEPLAHVDAPRHARLWDALVATLAARDASLVFASHDTERVLRHARQVACLDRGRLTFTGPTEELYERPPTAALAHALGPANWIEPATADRFFFAPLASPCVRPHRVRVVEHAASPVVVDTVATFGARATLGLRHADGSRLDLTCGTVGLPGPGARVRLGVVALLVACALLLGACSGDTTPALSHAAIHHVAIPPDGTLAPAPRAIVPGVDGELLVLDNAGRVLVLDADGAVRRQWRMPTNANGNPEGVCRLHDGRIVVADTHYHQLVVFDADGHVLRAVGHEGTGPVEFLYPVRVIQAPDGALYVAEYGSNDRVQKLTTDFDYVLEFGSFGTGPGELQRANGLVWHDGTVYVSDAVNLRVQAFTDDGRFRGIVGGDDPVELRFPYDIALGPDGLLYVAEYGAGRITALTRDGQVVGRLGSSGSGPGQLATPWALCCVPRPGSGLRLWIADTGNRRLVRVDRDA